MTDATVSPAAKLSEEFDIVSEGKGEPSCGGTSDLTRDLELRVKILERHVEDLRIRLYARRDWRDRFKPTLFTLDQYPPRNFAIPERYFSSSLCSDPPTIAIVTPSFNYGSFIERTICSVLDQRYPALDYVVQDGGSTDATTEVLKKYERRLSWASEPDEGQAHAVNLGFAKAKGEIMGWLNSDDMQLPGTLAYIANFFSQHHDIDVLYGHRICIDRFDKEIGRIILPKHDPEVIKWVDFVPQETLFWRRSVWEKLGGLDPTFNYAMDWDFILRAHASGFRFHRLPRFLGCFRIHDMQKTTSERDVGEVESARLRQQYLGRTVSHREIESAIRSYLRRHVLTVRGYKLGILRY